MPRLKDYHHWMYKVEDGKAIVCGVCKMKSYHPMDIEKGYCGKCQQFYNMRSQVFTETGECVRCKSIIVDPEKDQLLCYSCINGPSETDRRIMLLFEEDEPVEDEPQECDFCEKVYYAPPGCPCPLCTGRNDILRRMED